MDFGSLLQGFEEVRSAVEARAATYLWIDRTARTMDRSGRDASGAVHTELDHDNIPRRFTISQNWQSLLNGQRLDAAILEAFGAAYADGWKTAREEVEAAGRRGVPPPALVPEARTVPVHSAAEDLIEEVLAISAQPLATPSRDSSDTPRAIEFAFSEHGMSGCRIDQEWAERQATSRLATEINAALQTQRDEYAHGRVSPTAKLTAAAEQLIALLHSNNVTGGN
ncbi:hypothetical protein AB0H71_07095 [Nocardia sp. NPDC050697]|uniref:hypothetical protein n=1 Tax=Nocardia sp. NPDC050697 TaxID=3155158 RepID=UPI00340FDE9A